MTKSEITAIMKETCCNAGVDTLTDILRLSKFTSTVKWLSPKCYQSIYDLETLTYKVQAEFCEQWSGLFNWDRVEHTRDYTYYYLGNLSVVVEEPY